MQVASQGGTSTPLPRAAKPCAIVAEFQKIPERILQKTLADERPPVYDAPPAEVTARALEALTSDKSLGEAFKPGNYDTMLKLNDGPAGIVFSIEFASAVDLPSSYGVPKLVERTEGTEVALDAKGQIILTEADPAWFKGVRAADFHTDRAGKVLYIIPSSETKYCWVEFLPEGGWRAAK